MSEADKDVLSAYTEETWGKKDEGEDVIDGYSFKGKRAFLKALEGLRNMIKRGFVEEINGIKIKVLDRRINGAGLDVVIECVENKNRGNAVLKLYGPSTKKKNVVTVTKSKGSEHKYLIMLAEKVIRPLIDQFLNNEGKEKVSMDRKPNDEKVASVCGKKVKSIKCPYCEKTSYSAPGLKGHITKMHKVNKKTQYNEKRKRNQDTVEKLNENDHIYDEANKVINLLLEEVIDLTEEKDESIKDEREVTLDETICEVDENSSKKYYNKCDNCEYVVDACRRYGALQLLLKHKKSCAGSKMMKSCGEGRNKCSKCEFIEKDSKLMKRHIRDVHGLKTESTSPPPKKWRISVEETIQEPMETEEEQIKDLSLDFEEMEIDNLVTEKLSKLNDNKIKEKQIIFDEEEELRREKITEDESNKNVEEVKKSEELKSKNKKRKQSVKDQRKSINKRTKKSESIAKVTKKEKSNIKDIPENCKHLVKDSDIIYTVPGNGCCGPNSAAAFLFLDEKYGPKLKKRMNLFMVKHWKTRYQYLTQCSPGHPFVRKHKDGDVSYDDPDELLEFLKTSTKSYIYVV